MPTYILPPKQTTQIAPQSLSLVVKPIIKQQEESTLQKFVSASSVKPRSQVRFSANLDVQAAPQNVVSLPAQKQVKDMTNWFARCIRSIVLASDCCKMLRRQKHQTRLQKQWTRIYVSKGQQQQR